MADNSNSAPPDKPRRKNGPGRPFVKGQPSPNPGGRAKAVREALEAFRKPADMERLRLRLIELAESDDGRTAVAAIREYNDRAYGKPTQAITGPDNEPLFVSDIAGQLEKLAKKLTDGG